jgi:O-antigen ligase
MQESIKLQKLAIFSVILTTLIIFPIFMDPINLPKFFILLVGGTLVLIFLLLNNFYVFKSIERILLVLISIYIVLLSIAGYLSDQSLFATLTGTWGRNNGIIMSFLLILYFLIFTLPTNKNLNLFLLNSLFYLGSFSSIYAWLQFFNKDPLQYFLPWYNKNDAIIITVGNSNFASIFLAMTFSASLALLLQKPNLNLKSFICMASVIIHLVLIPKLDTQGKISFAIGAVVVIGIFTIFSKNKFLKFFGIFWWFISLLTALLGVIGLAGKGYFAGVLSDNVRSLTDRYYAWKVAIEMMKDSPFFGRGIDSFGFYYRFYRDKNSSEILSGQPYISYDNAHNTYLQLGATAGIPTLIIYIILIIFICWRMVIAWKVSEDKSLVAGLSSIWIIYLIQSFVSMDQIGIAVWGWSCAGALIVSSRRNKSIDTKKIEDILENSNFKLNKIPKFIYIPLGAMILSIPSIYYIPVLKNESDIYFAIRNIPRLSGDFEKQENFNNILNAGYKAKQLELRLTIIRYLGAVNLTDKALALATYSAEQEPRSFSALHLVAGLYELSGQYKSAIPARELTIKLDPHNELIKQLLTLNINESKKP